MFIWLWVVQIFDHICCIWLFVAFISVISCSSQYTFFLLLNYVIFSLFQIMCFLPSRLHISTIPTYKTIFLTLVCFGHEIILIFSFNICPCRCWLTLWELSFSLFVFFGWFIFLRFVTKGTTKIHVLGRHLTWFIKTNQELIKGLVLA